MTEPYILMMAIYFDLGVEEKTGFRECLRSSGRAIFWPDWSVWVALAGILAIILIRKGSFVMGHLSADLQISLSIF